MSPPSPPLTSGHRPTGEALPARPAAASAVEATYMVLPGDTNSHGTAFGGKIMQWMDISAAVAAGRHCGGPTVTVAVDELHFAQPIRMGDVVVVRACVNFAGRSSLEVGIRVERESLRTHVTEHCLSGYFTFVGVDELGRPTPVPGLILDSDIERRRFVAAQMRRERRLQARKSEP